LDFFRRKWRGKHSILDCVDFTMDRIQHRRIVIGVGDSGVPGNEQAPSRGKDRECGGRAFLAAA
jgi:hypothetical protein